eukprot:1232146-Rhodomonas_salina.3
MGKSLVWSFEHQPGWRQVYHPTPPLRNVRYHPAAPLSMSGSNRRRAYAMSDITLRLPYALSGITRHLTLRRCQISTLMSGIRHKRGTAIAYGFAKLSRCPVLS